MRIGDTAFEAQCLVHGRREVYFPPDTNRFSDSLQTPAACLIAQLSLDLNHLVLAQPSQV